MKINCDIGERGIYNQIDIELMRYIDIANIACGGHSGDQNSVDFFSDLARKHDVQVSAHLSYPDKINFGRISLKIDEEELINSLNFQLDHFKNVKIIKFHGALYNNACSNTDLAILLTGWLGKKNIDAVLTLPDSELAEQCRDNGIYIYNEAFIERRYEYDQNTDKFSLRSRKYEDASIKTINESISQFTDIFNDNKVSFIDSNSEKRGYIPMNADTVCIHSDSEIALLLAKNIRTILKK